MNFIGFWIVKGIVEWELGIKYFWGSIGRIKKEWGIKGKREGDIFDEVKLKVFEEVELEKGSKKRFLVLSYFYIRKE